MILKFPLHERMEVVRVDEAMSDDARRPPDVYFTPAYGAACAVAEGGTWVELRWCDDRVRLPLVISHGKLGKTIQSPYGYSGPWATRSADEVDWPRFRRDLSNWADAAGIEQELLRFNPFTIACPQPARLEPGDESVELVDGGVVIVVDIGDADAYWGNAQGRHRTAVRKARRAGYVAEVRPACGEDVGPGSPFRRIYEARMRAVEARDFYTFPDEYYQRLEECSPAELWLSEAKDRDGDVVAAALFLRWGELVHYHLSGSRPNDVGNGVNNLLLDSTVRYASTNGCRRMNLGGGATSEAGDPLLRFKLSLGGQGTAALLTRRRYTR